MTFPPLAPLRTRAERARLVHDIYALPVCAQETRWLEWKRSLELSSKHAAAVLSRGVLGFSNRCPTVAEPFAGGEAFLVVGVSPGRLDGVEVIDGAAIVDKVRPYVGDNVDWTPDYVRVAGRNVLVMTVAAPKWGDEINACLRAYDPPGAPQVVKKGAVYVRRQASTESAVQDDYRMLARRYARGQQPPVQLVPREPERRLELLVHAQSRTTAVDRLDLSRSARNSFAHTLADGTGSRRFEPVNAAQEELADTTHAALRRQLLLHESARHAPGSARRHLKQERQYRPERLDERRDQRTRQEAIDDLVAVIVNHVMRQGLAPLNLCLHNPTDTTLTGLEIELQLPVGCFVVPGAQPSADAILVQLRRARQHAVPRPRLTEKGRAVIGAAPGGRPRQPRHGLVHRFDPVTIRPERSYRLPTVSVFATDLTLPGTRGLFWSASATNIPGRTDGRLDLEVSERVWTPQDLLLAQAS